MTPFQLRPVWLQYGEIQRSCSPFHTPKYNTDHSLFIKWQEAELFSETSCSFCKSPRPCKNNPNPSTAPSFFATVLKTSNKVFFLHIACVFSYVSLVQILYQRTSPSSCLVHTTGDVRSVGIMLRILKSGNNKAQLCFIQQIAAIAKMPAMKGIYYFFLEGSFVVCMTRMVHVCMLGKVIPTSGSVSQIAFGSVHASSASIWVHKTSYMKHI